MKPLLRAVLIIDAVLLLAFGVLFVLTPWQSLFNALQLANVQPAMLGQAFGIALLGSRGSRFMQRSTGISRRRSRVRSAMCIG